MKKIFFIAAATAMLLLSMTSCNKQKDGVFNPKQKISKIYYSYNSIYSWDFDTSYYSASRHLREQWEWDGKQLVSRTIFFESGSICETYTYTYEDKRLSRMDYSDMTQPVSGYITFSYDGKELSSADMYEGWNGKLDHCATYRFTHTDGKITAIDVSYEAKNPGARKNSMMLDMILSFDFHAKNVVASQQAKDASDDIIRYELTWTGNNVSQIRMTNGDYGGTFAYTYDDKKNPFYGSWRTLWLELDGDANAIDIIHKNNPVTATFTSTDYDHNNYTYTYTYKDDYPVTSTVKTVESSSGSYFRYYESTDRYEFEYLK